MIFLVILFGLVLRLISLNQSFWLDEATSGLVVRNFDLGEIITKFSPGDFHPPLYYLILKLWAGVFGTGEIALRMPSVIFGVATVYIIYLIGRKMISKRVGLIAAALAASSGLLIYYSQEARMYGLVTLLISCLVYLFFKKRWLLFSIVLALIGLTDYPALLVIPVFWLASGKNWRKLAVAHVPLLFAFAFWSSTFLSQMKAGLAVNTTAPGWWQILGKTNFKELALIPTKFILGRISFDDKVLYALIVGLVTLLFGYLVFRSTKLLKSTRRVDFYWLAIPIALAALIGFKISIFSYFRLLFVLPAFYLLVAVGISSLSRKWRKATLILVLFVNFASSVVYLTNTRFHREDWRRLVSFIENQKFGKSVTLFVADANMEAYRYYAPGANIAGPKGFNTQYQEIWLMRYLQPVFDSVDSLRAKIEASGYNKKKEYNFSGVVVWKYEK